MFPELTGNGRVWIHVANRPLDTSEIETISERMKAFTSQWQAHGADLLSSFEIYKDQVLILAVDENFEAASGCSIDTAFGIFKEIDATYDLDMFNRLNLPFLTDGGIQLVKMSAINEAFESGAIHSDSILLDTSLSTLNDLRTRFHVPLASSWLARKIKTLV